MAETMESVNPIIAKHQARQDAMLRRQQQISVKVESLTSDPLWEPTAKECERCSFQNRNHESGGSIWVELDEGGEFAADCPVFSPNCQAARAQEVSAQDRAIIAERNSQLQEQTWLQSIGVGERYWAVTREGLRVKAPIIAYLDELCEQTLAGRGLVLLGTIGVGKTAALSLIAKEARGQVRDVWFTTVTRLMRHLLREEQLRRLRDNDGYEYEYDPKKCRLLLLDEFGAAYESDYAMAAFEDYIGWRYDNKLATCVAGNLTPEQLRENPHYARMVDRWRETCVVVKIGGDSMRQSDISAQVRAAQ